MYHTYYIVYMYSNLNVLQLSDFTLVPSFFQLYTNEQSLKSSFPQVATAFSTWNIRDEGNLPETPCPTVIAENMRRTQGLNSTELSRPHSLPINNTGGLICITEV